MSSISLRFSNSFVPSSFPAQVLKAANTQLDKVTKIAIVATLALAILVGLALCYAGKIKKWVQTPYVHTQSNYQQQRREDQQAANIPLNRAKELGDELKALKQTSKSEKELIEYFKVSPNIERIHLEDCVLSKTLIEKIPKKVKTIDLTGCHFTDSFLEGLQSLDKLQPRNLSLNFYNCDLKNVNLVIPSRIQGLTFSYCTDVSLKSLSARFCLIENCKNLLIDSEEGDVEELHLFDCPDVSLDHLPKTIHDLSLDGCPNLSSLEHLPGHLEKLEISGSRCTFTHPTLDRLPKDLRYLDITLSHSSQSVDALPSGLQTLVLWCHRDNKPSLVDALPSGMQTLELHGAKKPSLDHLPQNLKTIKFGYCDLTNVSFDSLPDSLEQIIFKDCQVVSLNNLPEKIRKKVSMTCQKNLYG